MEQERAAEDREFTKDVNQLAVELEKNEPTTKIGRLLRTMATRSGPSRRN